LAEGTTHDEANLFVRPGHEARLTYGKLVIALICLGRIVKFHSPPNRV
jgi:hypothetical protein